MLTKVLITADELANMVEAVLVYNRRGRLMRTEGGKSILLFRGANGESLELGWIEAVCDDAGLAVRTMPEDTPDEIARRYSKIPVEDPRVVQQPASMDELAKALGEA